MEPSPEQLERLRSVYYLYLDEFGHATFKPKDVYNRVNDRFLTLAGIFLRGDLWWQELCKNIDKLKIKYFGTSQIMLHYSEMARFRGPFSTWSPETRDKFWENFLDIVASLDCQIISMTIDKERMQAKYKEYLDNPYHLLLVFHIERFIYFLEKEEKHQYESGSKKTGPPLLGKVIIESRGHVPDKQLQSSYKRIYTSGSKRFQSLSVRDVQRRMMSNELAICSKKENRKGLEVADMICNALHWNSLFELCPAEINLLEGPRTKGKGIELFWDKLKHKITQDQSGNIKGYGIKVFPDPA